MNIMNITSKRLRKLREEMGLSQGELAKKLGISRTAYVKYETGESKPMRKLQELSDLFNVSIDYLLGNDIESKEKPNDNVLTNDMNQFLSQAQIIFDGNAVNLSDKDRDILEQSLKIAFMAIEKQREGGNNGNEESH